MSLAEQRAPKPLRLDSGIGGVGTQDLYFWGDARKYGYRCAIDNSCLVGHYDISTDTCW